MIKTKNWRDAEAASDVNMNTEDWMADEIDGLREELTEAYKQRVELLEALKVVLPIATKSNSLSVKDYNKAVQAILRAAAQIEMSKCKDN